MSASALHIYMDDHFAMIIGELELVQRVARENESTELGRFLQEYEDSLSRQRDVLSSIMQGVGIDASPLKQTVTWLAEKVGRLKPNDAFSEYTDLARVPELEMLISGAELRLLLWETLRCETSADQEQPSQITRIEEVTAKSLASLREFHEYAKRTAFDRQEV